MIFRIFVILMISLFMGTMIASANPSAEKKESTEELSEFVEIPPISVAMYNRRKRPAGTMTVLLQLKIDDSEQRAEAVKVMPRLKNAYMQETLKLALNFFDIDRPVNANLLSRSLQNATNIVLKHENARVLISDVAVMKR